MANTGKSRPATSHILVVMWLVAVVPGCAHTVWNTDNPANPVSPYGWETPDIPYPITPDCSVVSIEPSGPLATSMNHCSLDNDRCPLSTEPAVVGDFQPFPFSGEFESLELDWSPLNRSIEDHRNFYSPHSLLWLTGGLAVGGLMANTSGDEVIQRHFQASVLGASSDSWYEWFHASKELGNGYYTLPIMAGAYLTSELLPETTGAQRLRLWSERSVRGTLVGAPPLIGLQLLTGGSRPNETDRGSRWSPFDDNNGISGHSFMGALPFITAAKVSENRLEKAGWYAASFMAPLSRVNDDAHYPSQVALGWWMAYLAASAVATTDAQESIWVIVPYADANGTGVVGATRF